MPSTHDALEVKTMRQVAVRIVPFMMACYFVAFLDRVNLGFAAPNQEGTSAACTDPTPNAVIEYCKRRLPPHLLAW